MEEPAYQFAPLEDNWKSLIELLWQAEERCVSGYVRCGLVETVRVEMREAREGAPVHKQKTIVDFFSKKVAYTEKCSNESHTVRYFSYIYSTAQIQMRQV